MLPPLPLLQLLLLLLLALPMLLLLLPLLLLLLLLLLLALLMLLLLLPLLLLLRQRPGLLPHYAAPGSSRSKPTSRGRRLGRPGGPAGISPRRGVSCGQPTDAAVGPGPLQHLHGLVDILP